MRVIKTISLDSKRDREIIRHLDSLPNASEYIRKLISMDLGLIEDDDLYSKLIEKLLSKVNMQSNTDINTPAKEIKLDTTDKLQINKFFQMK